MTDRGEIDALRSRLLKEFDRAVAALDGLTDAQAAWTPAEGASSVLSLAAHAIGSTLGVVALAGGDARRDRDAEFLAPGDPADVRARAAEIRERLTEAFDAIDPAALDMPAPSAPRTGAPAAPKVPAIWTGRLEANTLRDVLLARVTHVAEHVGHAELTRGLARRSIP